jgi:hypothetical protein
LGGRRGDAQQQRPFRRGEVPLSCTTEMKGTSVPRAACHARPLLRGPKSAATRHRRGVAWRPCRRRRANRPALRRSRTRTVVWAPPRLGHTPLAASRADPRGRRNTDLLRRVLAGRELGRESRRLDNVTAEVGHPPVKTELIVRNSPWRTVEGSSSHSGLDRILWITRRLVWGLQRHPRRSSRSPIISYARPTRLLQDPISRDFTEPWGADQRLVSHSQLEGRHARR